MNNNYDIVGVRFFTKDKTNYIKCADDFNVDLKLNDKVIVKFKNKIEDLAVVVELPETGRINHSCLNKKENPEIVRLAESKDIELREELDKLEKDALPKCNEFIKKHNLPMFLLDAHYTLYKNKITFYFSAAQRIDFRQLVKDLAHTFKTRIELYQIGIRDECKRLGGIGVCGRETCCSTFLFDFSPVTIKMAKNQMLNLTPTKISGICGRLLCCLSYEDEHYKEQLEKYPAPYCMFKINNDNTGKVINCNVLKSTVTYSINNGYCKEISLKEFIELYGDKLDYSADNKKSENIVKKNI